MKRILGYRNTIVVSTIFDVIYDDSQSQSESEDEDTDKTDTEEYE